MLVRLGAADSVPAGQRIARAPNPRPRGVPALSAGPRADEPEPAYAYVQAEDLEGARRAQRACEAYQAAELIQPRPGLIIRIQA